MAAQEWAAPATPRGVDAAAGGREPRRQKAIFEEREAELLERHSGRDIGVCGGEVFVGDSTDEVADRA